MIEQGLSMIFTQAGKGQGNNCFAASYGQAMAPAISPRLRGTKRQKITTHHEKPWTEAGKQGQHARRRRA